MMFIDKLRAESEARGEARGEARARARARAKSIEKGRSEGKLEVVQSMLAAGMDFESVLRFTGISEELLFSIFGPHGEKIKMFIDKIRAESEARGRSEGKLEVAQSMLAAGMDFESVLRFTGLSEEVLLGIKDTPS